MTNLILLLLIINFIADQLLMPKPILDGKNHSIIFMALHVLMWALPMALFAWIVVYRTEELWALKWLCAIVPLHFLIEYPINKYTTYLLQNKKTRMAITMIHLEKMLLNIAVAGLFVYFCV